VCKSWKSLLLVRLWACRLLVGCNENSHEVEIRAPRVFGFLEKRLYNEGAIVKEGQVLFLMGMKPFPVQVEGAKAALAVQKAVFETARLNLRPAPHPLAYL
jgi:membrane fusion protein (multidrug efflux system)